MTRGPRAGRPPRLVPFPGHRAASPRDTPPPGASTLFVNLLLVSLGILFAAAIVAHAVIRVGTPGAAAVDLPVVFWPATLLLAAASAALGIAVRAAEAGASRRLRASLTAAAGCGLFFLLLQAWGWSAILADARAALDAAGGRVRAVQLVFLTALHAAHVAGGIAALLIVAARSARGGYGPGSALGVRLAARYWHFLGAVWLVLLAVLVLVG